MKKIISLLLFSWIVSNIFAQEGVILEGYVFADDNSGYLRQAHVTLYDNVKIIKGEAHSNKEGFFSLPIEAGKTYELIVRKNGFNNKTISIDAKEKAPGDKVYVKLPLGRAPGYIFEATVADWRPEDSTTPVDAIEGTTIEVYNNTTQKEELVLDNHLSHAFNFRMEQGNHYTIMLRKEGYFNKRIEANVAVNGCLLCFEGMGKIRPGVADNLSHGNLTGTLGANISMRKIELDKAIKIDNIYYDLAKSYIRDDAAVELDKLVKILKDNPHIFIELSSHTDARGNDGYNEKLSQERAEAAAEYIVSNGILKNRITAKGYGENTLVNKCADGVRCNEKLHQENRRTEFKVTGIMEDHTAGKKLSQIIEGERFESMLTELSDQEIYVAKQTTQKTKKMDVPTRKKTIPQQPQTKLVTAKKADVTTHEKVTPKQPQAKPKTKFVTNKKPIKKAIAKTIKPVEKDTGAFGEKRKAIKKVKKAVNSTKTTMPSNTTKLVENTASTPKSTETVVSPTKNKKFKIKTKKPQWNTKLSTDVIGDVKESKTEETATETGKFTKQQFLKNKTRARLISNSYTGYKIEIQAEEEELKAGNPLFKEMGGIEVDVLPNESYSYMIGQFRTTDSANKFLASVLVKRFPDAQVVQYKNGIRVK